MSSWFADYALLPDGLARDVRFDVIAGRLRSVTADSNADDAERLPGVVVPGLANCHSHAFHRALRGRTHAAGGTFWTWREQMYAVAARLDPDRYLDLARAAFAEMALAGVTTVGEFHYLHHGPGGQPYVDPNAMAEALRHAAADAGVRLTLLDACYLIGGLDANGPRPLDDTQRRFADLDVDAWAARVGGLAESPGMRVGVAVHSIRAVPRAALPTIRVAADGRPLHVHLSEQPAENAASLACYGATPAAVLDDAGLLGPRTTAVHATHLTTEDVGLLGSTSTTCCICPTTERDLADGIGPARALADAGAPLSLGSDQHAVVDLFEDARGLEMHERLTTQRRGRFTPAELLAAATRHDSLGWPDAGRLAPGARADLVAVRLDTVRTAGCDPAQVLYAATAADVDTVVVDGEPVVRAGRHRLGDVGRLLADAIGALR
ncbi:formimidoylglutamate deiminase [uncultured Jatrophihabitans sp.]|uniref:formimidoylglutamate deiminase n=1 Tax=uncultured Jatrophihabitans sp. TaxID=1610747 RepID=UPI0035CBD73A